MDFRDLLYDEAFPRRQKHERDAKQETAAMRRLAFVFAENPEIV